MSVLVGCNGDDTASTQSTATGPDATISKENAPLQVKIAKAVGLKASQRAAVQEALSKPIAAWIDGAFVGPQYPTTDFSAGFTSWTPKAAALAKKDADYTSNAALGDKVVGVVADRQTARLYVFAVNGKTGGASARVQLRLTEQKNDGTLAKVSVGGQLYLTKAGNTWRIFGYDLSRTEAAA